MYFHKHGHPHSNGQRDMLHGPLPGKILLFSIPLIASGILQQSFNAIDVAIVGRYCPTQAIAAVGSNGPIISMLVNLFLGIAVGANAVIARYIGGGDKEGARRSIDTVAILSIVSGLLLTLLGTTLARPILEAMTTPSDVIDLAEEYLRIFFCGMPFMMIYNFGSAIMRSVGDTKLPFYALLASTVCNLLLDWLFVGIMDAGVSGAAWGTVIATGVNAGIIVCFLTREQEPVRLSLHCSRWRITTTGLRRMLAIGIPAGLQGMVFSISNIFIQSAINSFGADASAGSAAALTYETYCYYIISSFCAATIAFTGQNYGARQYDRCRRVLRICLFYSIILCSVGNILFAWHGQACISLFSDSPEVMHYAMIRFHTVLLFQSLASFYEIPGSYMRALGYSLTPMLLTVVGTCLLRLGWVAVFRDMDPSFHGLLTIYPVSWIITGVSVLLAETLVQRKVFRRAVSSPDT